MDGFGQHVPGRVSEHWKVTEKECPTVQGVATATVLELLNMGGEVHGDLVAAGVGPTLPACTGALTTSIIPATCTTLRHPTPSITIQRRLLDLGPVPRIDISTLATQSASSNSAIAVLIDMRDGGQVYFTSVAFRLLYDCHASPSHFLVHLCCVAELGIAMRQHLLMLLWLLGSLFRDQDIYRDLFDYLGLPQVSIFIKSLYFPISGNTSTLYRLSVVRDLIFTGPEFYGDISTGIFDLGKI